MIVIGMWMQAAGILIVATAPTLAHSPAENFSLWIFGSVLLGVGTALVYPTLLAAIGDVVHPAWRASAVGVYRLWRDLGYAAGALLSGAIADLFGLTWAILVVAFLTFASGVIAALRMTETSPSEMKAP
jgi:MFS family permease